MEQINYPADKPADSALSPEQKKESDLVREISEIKNEETENSQTRTMTRPQIPKKKIKTYLFEFLMLFFAVFCGFMADNLRENLSENQREKIFIRSIVEDIKSDTTESNTIL